MTGLPTWTPTAASALLVTPFLWSGLTKLFDFEAAETEMQGLGLRPARLAAAAVILVQLGGSALVVSGHGAWIGAVALGAFTLVASLMGHAFWSASHDKERTLQLNAFLANIGLIGGLVLAALISESAAA